jgi:hypothetical protein
VDSDGEDLQSPLPRGIKDVGPVCLVGIALTMPLAFGDSRQ